MRCPECGKEISKVNVISTCGHWQKAILKGDKMIAYGCMEEIIDTTKIECPECCIDIQDYIKEGEMSYTRKVKILYNDYNEKLEKVLKKVFKKFGYMIEDVGFEKGTEIRSLLFEEKINK